MTEQKTATRTIVGTVTSVKMNKTIVVEVERKIKHPLYGKYIKRSSKMYAHDEDNVCKVGDLALIASSRPLSKTKHFVLVKVLEQAEKEVTE